MNNKKDDDRLRSSGREVLRRLRSSAKKQTNFAAEQKRQKMNWSTGERSQREYGSRMPVEKNKRYEGLKEQIVHGHRYRAGVGYPDDGDSLDDSSSNSHRGRKGEKKKKLPKRRLLKRKSKKDGGGDDPSPSDDSNNSDSDDSSSDDGRTLKRRKRETRMSAIRIIRQKFPNQIETLGDQILILFTFKVVRRRCPPTVS